MPETPQEIVNRELREFRRYTGDGLPGEPISAPLPVGDPQSGVHSPKKAGLRSALLAPLVGWTEQADRAQDEADRAQAQAERAEDEADRAAGYASDALTGGMDPGLSTVGGIAGLTIPSGVAHFRVSGYYAAGDGGEHQRVKGTSAGPDAKQSADGAWWEVALPYDKPEAFGAFDGQVGNIPQYVKYLAARAPYSAPKLPIIRDVPKPKLHLFSSIAAGKAFHGFPSAVRYSGKDYVLYREGTGHVEPNPVVGTAARLVCSTRQVNGIAPDSRTIIYAPSAIDPRDPNVLRDDSGSAILVGGKFKVVIFEWNSTYSVATAKVFDLDPANLAAGLTNPVTIPTIKAVKSDVRLLSNGSYAFIGYDLTNTCHLVTTTDWATFNTEVIGPGNEAALCETYDGYLNAIVRAEENFGHCATIFYKKSLSGGGWYVHSILPYTLNAPTLIKGQDIRSISIAPGGNEGWLLFARDKTGKTALTNFTEPTSELVCFRSKEDFGRTITRFIDRKAIAGTANGGLASSGDDHYCSVVAGKYSGQLDIYTYGEFRTAFDNASTPFSVMVWRLEAEVSPDDGVRTISRKKKNYVKNASFAQGAAGYDLLTGANASVISDAVLGRNVLRLTDVISGSFPSFVVDCEAGETLFLKLRTKLNFSDLAGTGRHLIWSIADFVTGTAVTIQSETPNPNPLDFLGVWRTIVCRPFVAPSNKLKISLSTVPTLTDAETDVAQIEISDDYSSDLNSGDRVGDTITPQVSLNFPASPTGGAKASGTYSASFWDLFGLPKKASGVPLAAQALGDITVILSNCTTASGAVKVICTGVVVNSNGSVTADFAVAPGEGGTMSAQVSAKATVVIKAP